MRVSPWQAVLLSPDFMGLLRAFQHGIESDKLTSVQYLYGLVKSRYIKRIWMDVAAKNGHLHVIQHVHKNCHIVVCTTDAINGAATNGHLEVVAGLHTHRSEGCTTSAAMDSAAKNGHLAMLKLLHAKYPTVECRSSNGWFRRRRTSNVPLVPSDESYMPVASIVSGYGRARMPTCASSVYDGRS
ncbi:Aste57867_4492 [Aphanomyces stellatus]|uniref:Aste57867_4492 protein n=1 Tax=Aphanomyces stellatus TaxID=120398 RepID=A0A485KCW5_9STRA|nr:hypothetical protein As57867_004479 [Aphanomyces stellatus]VFT81602.1 Aste57867_4492 [Aphanomyces stellatus]